MNFTFSSQQVDPVFTASPEYLKINENLPGKRASKMISGLIRWLFNDATLYADLDKAASQRLDPIRLTLFIALHLACLLALFTGISGTAIVLMLALYFIRMFFITAFYHRYFSHKTYHAGRLMQFIMAVLGCTAGQRGPLWWASHHRTHHLRSDSASDPHSPRHGFLNSHVLWFLRCVNFPIVAKRVGDWQRYSELRLLERLAWLPFLLLAIACYSLGAYLQAHHPALETSGLQLLVWGFFISTVLLYHATYTINSLAHRFGSRRFNTRDDSRNNLLLALLTLGEGWHNNHHRYPASVQQGFYRGEIDISYWGIRLMAGLGLISDLRPVPEPVLQEGSR